MASNLRVDQITSSTTGSVSIGTATFTGGLSGSITGLNVTGVITATTLNQNVSGILTAQNGIDITGTSAIGNEQLQLSWINPNGQIKAKNTVGSPAANLDLYSTDTGGNTNLGIRLQYTGNVGIGSEQPANVLDVQGNAHTKIHVGTTGNGYATGIQINHAKGNAGQQSWQLQTDGTTDGNLKIRNATSGNDVMFFREATDNVEITNGNLVFSTAGKGIDFSATSDASGKTSELLDDYEEGTFTPEFADAASGGNTSGSYSIRVGQYVKIGRHVTINLYLDNADTTGLTAGNAAWIRGLPYAIDNGIINVGTVGLSNVNVDSTAYTAYAFANAVSTSQSGFRILQGRDATAHSTLLVSAFPDANHEIFVSMSYYSV